MQDSIFSGTVHKFPDHIDTDMIIPSRFLVTDNEFELGKHIFEDHSPDFHRIVKHGDIIIAGRNFGCGSSREHAPLAIRGSGITCIIAKSFARTFFRNCINRGFAVVECPEAWELIQDGEQIAVDIVKGVITNSSTGKQISFTSMPPFICDILNKGGLFGYIQEQLNKRGAEQ